MRSCLAAGLRHELGCQSFGSQAVDGDFDQLQEDQAAGIFFSPVLKLSPASQTGDVLPELLSRMSFTGKTRCVLDSLGDYLY